LRQRPDGIHAGRHQQFRVFLANTENRARPAMLVRIRS